jgi:hypothetical protein
MSAGFEEFSGLVAFLLVREKAAKTTDLGEKVERTSWDDDVIPVHVEVLSGFERDTKLFAASAS